MKYLLIIIFSLCITPSSVMAKKVESAENKKENLKNLQTQIQKEKSGKNKLQKRIAAINKDLSKTKNDMISIAANIQKNEHELKSLEHRIQKLETKKEALDSELKRDRLSISKLIIALQRIRRTPPEALLASPEAPYKIAQTALLMRDILPSLNRHAEKLKQNITTVSRVSSELSDEKEKRIAQASQLNGRYASLEKLIDKRQELYIKTNRDLKTREIAIQQISLKAKDLEDLVKRVEKNRQKELERKQSAFSVRMKPTPKIESKGGSRLPVSGIIRTGYNQIDELDAKSKGLTIEGRKAGLVVAPLSGKIQFTGHFKKYGNIIIIEHTNGFHSLIAGLGEISSHVGDIVKSGEPIGKLPDSSLIPRPTLYYELRKNGSPVNPALKFSNLG